MAKTRTKPIGNLLEKIKKSISTGKYRVSKHAIKRQYERKINIPDALYVLLHGFHEEEKTLYDISYQTWKYAIRGKTADNVDLRVIVAFDEEMIIITLIRMKK